MVAYKPRTRFLQEHTDILTQIVISEKRVYRPKLYERYPEFKQYPEKAIANKIISIKNTLKKNETLKHK